MKGNMELDIFALKFQLGVRRNYFPSGTGDVHTFSHSKNR